MKRPIITFTVLAILITACTPAAPSTPHTGPMPLVSKPAISQFESTPLTSEQATAQPQSSPTGQVQPAVTKKPKGQKSQSGTPSVDKTRRGKNPLPALNSTNPDFIATEITGRPTDNSITINLVPATGMEIYYEYGTTSGAYTARTTPQSAAAGMPLETLIDGLQPNTRYYYHLVYNGTAGAEHTFVTQRSPGNPFVFDIQGDSHPERVRKQFHTDLYTKTLLSAASDQPDFYIAMGDDFSVDALKTVTRETVTAQYINQRQWLGLVGAPIFLVNGNHEQASLANLDGTGENVAVWAQTARNAYYPQPAPDAFYSGNPDPVEYIGLLRNYYAWAWGDALFVVIDPYWHSPQTVDNQFGADRSQKKNRNLWNVTLGETQYRWFRQTLETSTAKYKFVFTHHINGTGRGGIELANSFEWGDSANLAAHRPGWDITIHRLMVNNHVTIFFQGHDHIFVKQQLDGVIYQTLPEPAHPGYTYENTDAYQTGDKFPNSGHVRVTVAPEGLKVEYIRSYLDQPDEIAFSYTVP